MKKLFLVILLAGLSGYCSAQDGDFYNSYFAGNAALVKGQWDAAIENYNEAIKSYPAAYAYYNRGSAYFGKKDYTKALVDYTTAIKLNSNYAEAYYQRGLLKNTTGDKTCCDDLKKAVKLELTDASAAFKKYCK